MNADVFLQWLDGLRSEHTITEAITICSGPQAGYIIAAIVPDNRQLETKLNQIIDEERTLKI